VPHDILDVRFVGTDCRVPRHDRLIPSDMLDYHTSTIYGFAAAVIVVGDSAHCTG
jgi:hypothetical protein